MDDRANTIAGWALAGGIAALGLSILSGMYFHSERPETMGYVVEGVEEDGEAGGAEAEKPIAFFLASADPAKGADVFKKCAACHNANKGGSNALGPNLWGLFGAPIGAGHSGYAFSDALKSKGGTWDWQNMSDWLKSPKTFAPGTKMTFAGLSKPEDRANILAYLNQQSDAPRPMPAVPAEAPTEDAAADNAVTPAEGNEAAPAAQ
jgi:cytochrome c